MLFQNLQKNPKIWKNRRCSECENTQRILYTSNRLLIWWLRSGKGKILQIVFKIWKERRSVNETLIENVEEVIVHLVKRAKIVNKPELKKLN